jgi:hypothetical protein
MKAFALAVLCVVVLAGSALAGQTTTTTPVLFDPDMTVGAGATISAAVGEAIAEAESEVVPVRLLAERGVGRRAANMAYRVAKLWLFDLPQERWIMVVNHEVFGHGGRLRERFDGPIRFHVDAPAPYGPGGGVTSFGFDRDPTLHELMTISAAGMEVDAVAADLVADRAFVEGRMSPRDAMRYLEFELDAPRYILNTDDRQEPPGHDVGDFLSYYNELAFSNGARTLSARQLQRETLVGLANPMLGYALFGIGRYLWNGREDISIPTISIAGVRYLPMPRYRLTPFGTEWALTNDLIGRLPISRVDVRIGRTPGSTPWGIGVQRRGLTMWQTWRLDLRVDLWRQPRVDEKAPEVPSTDPRFGAEVRGRLERPLIPVWFGMRKATVIVDIGVKSAGYVPGEPLRSGIVVRAGVGLPFDRLR